MTIAELGNNALLDTDRHLIAGRYRPHARIGSGRLGEIFAATDESYEMLGVEQRLAIQVIPEDIVRNNKLFNKLSLGYTLLRAAAHPNLVNYRQFGRDGKFGFLVMDHLEGVSLRFVLDDGEKLDLDEAKPVIRGVGEALRLLHAKGMLHGNLTARNVFITEDFEVRLLDVLPLDAAQATIRGGATSAPFSRCSVQDDVFGLACLSYEMLAGQHPFNYSTPAEAGSEGLQAERIASLTDLQWSALRHALSFDRDSRTPSIADFMRDFGINGTERLRPTTDQPPRHESIDYRAMEAPPPVTRVAVPVERPVAPTPVAATPVAETPVAAPDPVVSKEDRPLHAQPIGRPARSRRALLLGLLLAVLGAWSYYGQPREQVAELIAQVDEKLVVGLLEQPGGIAGIAAPTAGRPVPVEPVVAANRPAAAAPAATLDKPPADTGVTGPGTEPAAIVDEPAAALTDATDPAARADSAPAENTGDETTDVAAAGDSQDMQAGRQQAESQAVASAPIVSVSESDGVARIAVPPTGYSAAPLIWWTSEHTARSNEDFIAIEQRLMPDATVGDGNMLLVPLVNDSLPEPPESFFVSLGFRNSQQGQIERIATIRVDIADDD